MAWSYIYQTDKKTSLKASVILIVVVILIFAYEYLQPIATTQASPPKHYCYDLYSNGNVISEYYNRYEILRTQIGDSIFTDEVIRKMFWNDTGNIVARNKYLLLNSILYKQYTDIENKKIFLKYLSTNDTITVSNFSDVVSISQNELRFHLAEKNQTRKFLGTSFINGDSLYQFLFEGNQVDGVQHIDFYDKDFLLVKQINISGYTNVDSVLINKNCHRYP